MSYCEALNNRFSWNTYTHDFPEQEAVRDSSLIEGIFHYVRTPDERDPPLAMRRGHLI